ncbi:MAG: hypothetical protein N3A57_08530, partial [Negativicutes bacterium]|nr:hypothetical protein [Negativicutes bacterium]
MLIPVFQDWQQIAGQTILSGLTDPDFADGQAAAVYRYLDPAVFQLALVEPVVSGYILTRRAEVCLLYTSDA